MTALLREQGVDAVAFDYRAGLEAPTTEPLRASPSSRRTSAPIRSRCLSRTRSFDTVLSCGVLEQCRIRTAASTEIRRVLRPGGMFYVTNLPNRYSYTERARAAARALLPRQAARRPRLHAIDGSRTARAARLPRRGDPARAHAAADAGRPGAATWTSSPDWSGFPGLNLVATSLELVAYFEG